MHGIAFFHYRIKPNHVQPCSNFFFWVLILLLLKDRGFYLNQIQLCSNFFMLKRLASRRIYVYLLIISFIFIFINLFFTFYFNCNAQMLFSIFKLRALFFLAFYLLVLHYNTYFMYIGLEWKHLRVHVV